MTSLIPISDISDATVRRWFEVQREQTTKDATSHSESMKELAAGSAVAAAAAAATSWLALTGIPAVCGACSLGLGYLANDLRQKRDTALVERDEVVLNYRQWKRHHAETVLFRDLRTALQAQNLSEKQIDQARATFEKEHDRLETKSVSSKASKLFRKNISDKLNNLKSKIKKDNRSVGQEKLLKEYFQEIDQVVTQAKQKAFSFLFEAVKVRENDTRDLHLHHAFIPGCPKWVPDGESGIREL